jgi:oxaloacetate decarboxylase gamma subunit
MDNIVDGFKLMAIGMGMVFLFLTIMVGLMAVMAKALEPYAHLLKEDTVASSPGKTRQAPKAKSDDIVTAIIAAVHKYRSEH